MILTDKGFTSSISYAILSIFMTTKHPAMPWCLKRCSLESNVVKQRKIFLNSLAILSSFPHFRLDTWRDEIHAGILNFSN